MNRSIFIERVLINHLNNQLTSRGERPLDSIGKYISDEEMERLNAASDAAHAAAYAQRTLEFGAPPILRPSAVLGRLPRWTPPGPIPKKPKK